MTSLPKRNQDYASIDYWDQRYAQADPSVAYDWFSSLEVWPLLQPLLPRKDMRILDLGCGNSVLSEQLHDRGYEVVGLDYSEACIESMRKRRPDMTWVVGDIRHLPFDDASFDLVIDKGTMDALQANVRDPWNPPEEVVNDCKREVSEAYRVLKAGGAFACITWQPKHFRLPLLRQDGWQIEAKEIEPTVYWLYTARRAVS